MTTFQFSELQKKNIKNKMKKGKRIQLTKKICKWYFNKLIGKRTPIIAGFLLTSSSDRSNVHIYYGKSKGNYFNIAKESKKSRMNFVEFKSIIDSISPHVFYIYFSGKNLFSLRNLPVYLKYAKKKGIPFMHIISYSTSLLTDDKIKTIRDYADEISLNFDAADNGKTIRPQTAFKKLVFNVEKIKKNCSAKISIYVAFNHKYLDYYYKLADYAKKNNCHAQLQISNMYQGFKYRDSGHIEASNKLRKFVHYLKTQKNILNGNEYLDLIVPHSDSNNLTCVNKNHCNLPKYGIEFSSIGQITPCMNGTGLRTIPITKNVIFTMNSFKYDLILKKLKKCDFSRDAACAFNEEPSLFFKFLI